MKREILFKNQPKRLAGRSIGLDQHAPDFRLLDTDLNEVGLGNLKGKIKILTTFVSIDTSVCGSQIKEFNKRASQLSGDVQILGISRDLPFALNRFREENNISGVRLLSDYKYGSFGINYGLLIKELNLLARSVIILDKNNVIRYIQIDKEVTNSPNFDDALDHLKQVIDKPEKIAQPGGQAQCKACEGGVPALDDQTISRMLSEYPNWNLVEGDTIRRTFEFEDYSEAKSFLDLVAILAADQNHHPDATLTYNTVTISLTTHAAGGLTENDFIMARMINELMGEQVLQEALVVQ